MGKITLPNNEAFSTSRYDISRPVITMSLWIVVRTQFLHDISQEVLEHNIPDELIINVDQTPSKFVPTEKMTIGGKRRKTYLERVDTTKEVQLFPL